MGAVCVCEGISECAYVYMCEHKHLLMGITCRNFVFFLNTGIVSTENTIEGNRWGGVDVRLGSNPTVCRNTIADGLGDGIVIGERGQGVIENNIISGMNFSYLS